MPRTRPKRKARRTRGPPSSAGLITFMDEETHGIKIGPYMLAFLSILFIVIIIVLWSLKIQV